MSVTAFNECLQRPNQVKGGDKYQTELGVAGMKEKFGNNNINFVYSQSNNSGVEMLNFSAMTIDDWEVGIQCI